MFLALKEIKHEKLRYGLIILMIFLISYLIFMLSSLAVGLASENTQAIDSWSAKKIVLNKNSNISLSQSILTKKVIDCKCLYACIQNDLKSFQEATQCAAPSIRSLCEGRLKSHLPHFYYTRNREKVNR